MSAITESPESGLPPPGPYKPVRETAPSVLAAEEPTVARWVGFIGLFLVLVGGASLLFFRLESVPFLAKRGLGPLWGGMFVLFGLACLVYHAVCDSEVQIRRAYAFFGYLWLAAGAMLAFWPAATTAAAPGATAPPPAVGASTLFLPYGYVCFVMALLFLLPFVRHETDESWRRTTVYVIGFCGLVFAGVGLLGGNISTALLFSYGLLLAVLGLAYLWAFAVLLGPTEDLGYKVGLGVGVVGVLVILVAVIRSFVPLLFYRWGWISSQPQENYFESVGLLMMLVGLVYTGVAAGLSSDGRFMVLTRRELAAFFYSPLAYIVVFAFAAIAAFHYGFFMKYLVGDGLVPRTIQEPVVLQFLGSLLLVPAIAEILVVPLLTMRLLSEEQRSATLEVLLTAPVTDAPVVLSKFVAVLIVYMLTWAPYGLFLLVLRLEGGQSFDYMPLLSFGLALLCSGANYLAMGLFFSSVTRNQVVAGVLTAVAMIAALSMYFLSREAQRAGYAAWGTVLEYFSFVDVWLNGLNGRLYPRDVVFQGSLAAFWLFLTIKVLESRRWR